MFPLKFLWSPDSCEITGSHLQKYRKDIILNIDTFVAVAALRRKKILRTIPGYYLSGI